MAKGKMHKKKQKQKTIHRNLQIEQNESHKNRGELRNSGRVGSSCFIFGIAIVAATMRLFFFEICMLPTMINGQAFRIVT